MLELDAALDYLNYGSLMLSLIEGWHGIHYLFPNCVILIRSPGTHGWDMLYT